MEETVRSVETTLETFRRFGVTVNIQKSQLVPQETVKYLGVTVLLKDKSINPLQESLKLALGSQRKTVTPKRVASLGGRLLFLGRAVTGLKGLAKFYQVGRRSGKQAGLPRESTDGQTITRRTESSSQFTEGTNTCIFFYQKSPTNARLEVDAFDVGLGAVLHIGDSHWTLNGPFVGNELNLHITAKECMAVANGVQSFLSIIKENDVGSITVLSDCITAVSN